MTVFFKAQVDDFQLRDLASLCYFANSEKVAFHCLLHGQVIRPGTIRTDHRDDSYMIVDLKLPEFYPFNVSFNDRFHFFFLLFPLWH